MSLATPPTENQSGRNETGPSSHENATDAERIPGLSADLEAALEEHGLVGNIELRHVSGHRFILAEMAIPVTQGAEEPWAQDIPLTTDDGQSIAYEVQRIFHVSPHERDQELCNVYTYSFASRAAGIVYVHRVSRKALESLWNGQKERERSEGTRMLVGITPKFATSENLVRLTKAINAPCERCAVWVEFTVDTVNQEHPLCAACALATASE
jgi:hypothetical protein